MTATSTTIRIALSLALVAGGVALGAAACDDSSAVKEQAVDAGTPTYDAGTSGGPGGGDGGEKDCFEDPKTHFEIINACTNAVRIEKNPKLNNLLPDGGLPPLD